MRTVGEIIDRHRDAILGLWSEAARRAPSTQGLSSPELADVMPLYLSSLGRHGVDAPVELDDAQQGLLERHMANRLGQGFSLSEILTEFAILGRVVRHVIEAESIEERPAAADLVRLYAELHLASIEATHIFNEHMLEDEQTEKRYSRLLQDLAYDLRDDQPRPLRELLKPPLALIMKAMGAQTAALLLFDCDADRLVMSASLGDAREELEQHVGALDVSTFVGQIAASDAPMELADAETTELEVTDVLRRSGIHSLLGVRLIAGHLLRGVVYVGLRGRRGFTASELRRIQGLGRTLTLYLENARLDGALRKMRHKVDEDDALRERFVSVLMHDLLGPLAAAKADAQKLRAPAGLDDRAQQATHIVRELQRAEAMVAGLVDVHRIRAGQRLPLHPEECDLGAIARDACDEVRTSHGDRVSLNLAGGVRGMWSAEQLRRAIWNLVVNGLEHGAADAPVVVTVARAPREAVVSVHNQGPPIAARDQARLFRPFSTPGSAVRGPQPGWGLGLTLVWACAEAHGGRVEAESAAGQGTTFRLLLPYDARPYVD